ncbi:MAG: hypothetical protein RBS68_13945 [Anaerolineales bacterium]|jgi:hypothetical protein|nr:hypothetical protein [Anaerolineales bacterium]
MSNEKPLDAPPAISRHAERAKLGALLSAIGFLVFLIGSKPEWLGLDRSPVIGFVQITVFTLGLGLLCFGGYIGLASLWKNKERSILADIGARLIGTGYVVAVFAGMADIFGMGTQPLPGVPFFGPWQAVGFQAGQAMIAAGLGMMIPYQRYKKGPSRGR